MPRTDPLAAIRERDARAECVELPCHPGAHDRRALLALIDQRPPEGWQQFGTHANCRPRAQIEMSEEVGEDGLPMWERPVVQRPHIWGEETL